MINLAEVPNAKYRQRTSEGRISDKVIVGGELTHPYDVANDAYEQLPRNMDVLLPLGDGMLNRLVVREYNGKYVRQTASREDIMERLDPDSNWDEGMVLAPETKTIVEGGNQVLYLDNEGDGLAGLMSLQLSVGKNGNHGSTIPSNADYFKALLGVGDRNTNAVMHLRLQQNRAIKSPSQSFNSKDNIFDHSNEIGGRTSAGTGYESICLVENPDLQDFWALKWLHTSATSFMYQFRKDLKSLASQTQYLSNELFSFYQKGFKGDFLRSQTRTQIWLIQSLVEFGAAIRRHHWTYNGAIDSVSDSGRDFENEVINPFYLRLCVNGGKTLEFMPWWVAALYDRGHFDYEGEEHPDIKDIYREDLFIGLKTLFEAASLEQGMAWKGYSMPWMDFFDKFESGSLPDLYDENSIDAVRTLWYTGRDDVTSYREKKMPDTKRGSVPYFNKFIDKVTLSKQAPLDLELDLAELDKMPCMTGSRFKEGMQMLGPFEHSCYHRKARFEDRTVDVKYYPMMFMRPVVTTAMTYVDSSFDVYFRDGVTDLTDAQAKLDFALNGGADDADFNVNNVEWIGFPSIETGWAVLAEGVLHRCNNIMFGYGSTMIGENHVSVMAGRNNLGITLTTPELTDTNTGAGNHMSWKCHGGLPLSHETYWSPGINGILPSLFTVLHDIYAAWQNRTSGLFQRSELKSMMSWQSINLRSEMTMTTPNAKLSKYGKEIFNFMICASTGWDVGYAVRTVDRQLDSQMYHNRDGRPDLLVAPWNMESAGIEDTFSAMHLIGLLSGLFGPSRTDGQFGSTFSIYGFSGGTPGSGSLTDNDPYSKTFRGSTALANKNKQRFNPRQNEFSLTPRVTGVLTPIAGFGFQSASTCNNDRGHDAGRASFVRTIYDGPTSRDGAERKIAITYMVEWAHPDATQTDELATDQTPSVHALGKGANWFAVAKVPVYDFIAEVVRDSPNDVPHGSSAELIPGHRQLFRVWRLDYTTDLAGNANKTVGVKSLCSSFGTSGTAMATGSNVSHAVTGVPLPGFSLGQMPALTYVSELTGSNVVPTHFDNNDTLQYFEQRLGTIGHEPSDVRIWTENAPKLLVYDQDLHDHNEAMLGSILDLEYGVNHPGYITLLTVIKYDGSEEYRIEGSYGWEGGAKMESLEAVETTVTGDSDTDYSE